MKLIIYVIALAFVAINANILLVERWPSLEGFAKASLQSIFEEIQKEAFPSYSKEFNGFIFSNKLTILNFKITKLSPRYMFMSSTFYPPPNQNTYTVHVPLGFHMQAEFSWNYNFFIFPLSGSATLDTDVHSLDYNATLSLAPPEDIKVVTHINYTLVHFSEVETYAFFGLDKMFGIPEKLLSMTGSYLPLLRNSIEGIFGKVLPSSYNSAFAKSMPISLHFSIFQYLYQITSKLQEVTTRDSLLFGYGNSVAVPKLLPASDRVGRQYCIDQELFTNIVQVVWRKINGVFRDGDLPPNSVFSLTIPGLAMIIPDVAIEYKRTDTVLLSLEVPNEKRDIQVTALNETHAKASGFKLNLVFNASKATVLKASVVFELVVSPSSVKRGEAFIFNIKINQGDVDRKSISWVSKYRTVILSNLRDACVDIINGLVIPYVGHVLLGDGLTIKDKYTLLSQPEYSVTDGAICLNLAFTA